MNHFLMTTRSSIARTIPLLALMALAAIAPRAASAQGTESFAATHSATLDGDQERPVVQNAGSGVAVMRLNPVTKSLDYRITVALPEGETITAAHFHAGVRGVPGPAIHPITFQAGSKTAMGTWENMTDDQIGALNLGAIYVNVHTASHPDGMIRGQVMITPNLGAEEISPSQETGTIADEDTTATGQAFLWLDVPGRRLLYNVQWDDLTGPPTGAHFHRAPRGENGSIIHPIALPSNADTTGEASGLWDNLTETDIADLIAGNIYVNLHTAKYPGGEARGQIFTMDVYTAFISPANETGNVTGSNAMGTALLTVTGDNRLLGVAEINGTTGPITGAHIHRGGKGENGEVYLPLIDFSFFTGPGSWLALKSGVEPDVRTALRASRMYMNFHTGQYPNGEARGQLIPAATNLVVGSSSVPDLRPRAGSSAWSTWYDQTSGALHFGVDPARRDAGMTVAVYSALGQRITTVAVEPGSQAVTIGMLPSGSYMAQMIVGGEVVGISRIGVVR